MVNSFQSSRGQASKLHRGVGASREWERDVVKHVCHGSAREALDPIKEREGLQEKVTPGLSPKRCTGRRWWNLDSATYSW